MLQRLARVLEGAGRPTFLSLNGKSATTRSFLHRRGGSICNMSSKSRPLPSALPIEDRLIWVDCEMTGLEVERDALLEIAVVVTEGDTLEQVAATESIIISTPKDVLDKMNSWCVKQHGESGLTKACLESQISLEEAESMVMKVIEPVTVKGKSPLAGNTVSMDRRFLEKYMPRLASHLHYRTVDVRKEKKQLMCTRV